MAHAQITPGTRQPVFRNTLPHKQQFLSYCVNDYCGMNLSDRANFAKKSVFQLLRHFSELPFKDVSGLSLRNKSYDIRGVIKNYGECCCRVRSNGKAGIFNTGSGASNLSNSV